MKSKKISLFILMTIFLLVFSATPILAKYTQSDENNIGVSSPEFYFSSDLLEKPLTNGVYPQYKLSVGETSISFKLKNYLDELRFSEDDIKYLVSLTGNTNETKEGIITKGSCNDVVISFNNLTTGTYKVKVTTSYPYKTTLMADFIITEEVKNIDYVVNDAVNSSIVQVIITTNSYFGDLNISWPNDIFPDNSNQILKDAIGVNSFTINVVENAEYNLIFFKQDVSNVYTSSDIKVNK